MKKFLSHRLISKLKCGEMLVCEVTADSYSVSPYEAETASTIFYNGTVVVGSPRLREHYEVLHSMDKELLLPYLTANNLLEIESGECPEILPLED